LAQSHPLYLQATTACLSAVIVMQIVNVFSCRSANRSVVLDRAAGKRVDPLGGLAGDCPHPGWLAQAQGVDRAAGHDEVDKRQGRQRVEGLSARYLSSLSNKTALQQDSPNLSNSDQHQNVHWTILYAIA
jgi:hypothetical protein